MSLQPSSSQPTAKMSLGRDILRGTGIYSLALIAPKLASILLLPIYTRQLTPADYAVMDLLDLACNLLAMLFGSNLSAALFFFYFKKEDPEWRRVVSSTNMIGCVLVGAVFGGLGAVFAEPLCQLVFKHTEHAGLFRMTFLTIGFSFALESLLSWIRAENQPELYTGISIVRLALVVCGTMAFLVAMRMGIQGILLSNLLVTVAITVALGIYAIRKVGLGFDTGLLWQMAKYVLPVGIGSLALFVLNFADRFVLQRSVSMTELGQYSVAYKIGMLMAFVHGAFHTYWTSRAYEILKRPDRAELFAKLFTYLMALLSFAGLALVVATRPALTLLATKAYHEAALVVPVIVLAYVVRGAGDFLRILFAVHQKLEWDALCNWLGAGVCFALYLWWIPLYGTWGAAYATLVSFAFVYVVVSLRVKTLQPFTLETSRLMRLLGFGCMLGYASITLTPTDNVAVQVLLGMLFLALYPLLLWGSGFFRTGELDLASHYCWSARRWLSVRS
jgi:O-antigen/teichoic acid export membrane protein